MNDTPLERSLRQTGRLTRLVEGLRAGSAGLAALLVAALVALCVDAVLALKPWGLMTADFAASIVPPTISRKPSTISTDHGSWSAAISSLDGVPSRSLARYPCVWTRASSSQVAGSGSMNCRSAPDCASRAWTI